MRHRKKLIVAAITLVAGFAVVHFWPRDNAEARRLLDELRCLIESDQRIERPAPATAKLDADAQIEMEILVAKVNMTDATRGLFANSANPFNFKVVPLTSKQRITDVLRELCAAQAATIVGEPRLVVRPGKPASTAIRSQVPFPIKTPGPARNVGVNIGVTAKAVPSGRVELELECELSCFAEMIAAPQGINQPVLNSRKSMTGVLLSDQQTVLIGMAKKGAMPVSFKAPLLSDMTGIGPMFCFSWQRPIDEELIVLATPRIVYPR